MWLSHLLFHVLRQAAGALWSTPMTRPSGPTKSATATRSVRFRSRCPRSLHRGRGQSSIARRPRARAGDPESRTSAQASARGFRWATHWSRLPAHPQNSRPRPQFDFQDQALRVAQDFEVGLGIPWIERAVGVVRVGSPRAAHPPSITKWATWMPCRVPRACARPAGQLAHRKAARSGTLDAGAGAVRRMAPCSCGIMRRAAAGDEKRPKARSRRLLHRSGSSSRLGGARRWRCRTRRVRRAGVRLGEEARDRSRFGGVDGEGFGADSAASGANFSILRPRDQPWTGRRQPRATDAVMPGPARQ